jgi:amino-acid N-acetyltransferase
MNSPPYLPPGCQMRPAQARDRGSLRRLVLGARLDPTQLRWQQFWVVERQGEIIACGQLRTFGDCQELGSLVVRSPWRRQGLGTALTQHLIQQATQPLYLECLGTGLASFYQRLGFVPVGLDELPPALRRKFGWSGAIARLLRLPLHQMYRPVPQASGSILIYCFLATWLCLGTLCLRLCRLIAQAEPPGVVPMQRTSSS